MSLFAKNHSSNSNISTTEISVFQMSYSTNILDICKNVFFSPCEKLIILPKRKKALSFRQDTSPGFIKSKFMTSSFFLESDM